MKVSELRREMAALFAQVDERFAQVDKRFARVDERLERLELRMDSLERRLVEEGETTRRHFDVVAERMHAEVKLTIELAMTTHNRLTRLDQVNSAEHSGFRVLLDEHEVRLRKFEIR